MGYSTSFKLQVHAPQGEAINEADILAALKKSTSEDADKVLLDKLKNKPPTSGQILEELRNSNDNASYALSKTGGTQEPCKWYDHEKDMREFSKKYPETLFEMAGEGEESGDIWVEYYKNGKVQRSEAQITFEPFDEKKLK